MIDGAQGKQRGAKSVTSTFVIFLSFCNAMLVELHPEL